MSHFKYPNPMSAKKTRAAVRDLAINTDEQRSVLVTHERTINTLVALVKRPLLGRLRWIFTGK